MTDESMTDESMTDESRLLRPRLAQVAEFRGACRGALPMTSTHRNCWIEASDYR